MNDENAKGSSEIDTRFMIVAGSLLLLIIALLAGLCLRMRTRALRAEGEAARLRTQLKLSTGAGVRFSGSQADLEVMLQQMATKAMRRRAVQREDLKTEQVNLNGRDVKALRLPADAAETLGFRPGDVIIVEKTPTTTTSPIKTMPR